MKTWNLNTTELSTKAENLRAGDRVLLSGILYTARDAAHKRIMAALLNGDALPFPLEGSCIYFAGPTPTPDGMAVGSCGPTTSGRMDPYTPLLMDRGLTATIGKGERCESVREAIKRNHGVYLCALGGAGALAARSIRHCEVIAYDDLGCESVKRMYIEEFPLIVAIDCVGGTIFSEGRAKYRLA